MKDGNGVEDLFGIIALKLIDPTNYEKLYKETSKVTKKRDNSINLSYGSQRGCKNYNILLIIIIKVS